MTKLDNVLKSRDIILPTKVCRVKDIVFPYLWMWSHSVMSDSLWPYDCRSLDFSVHGILQARILECVARPSSAGSFQPRNWTHISCIAGRFFTTEPMGKLHAAVAAAAKSLQSCPTLCDPIDGSPLGSSVPGILQARILEWVAISSFRGSSIFGIKTLSIPLLMDT